jgi:hypothetical protein
MKFFNAMASLESGLTEFGHSLDQCGQVGIHRWFVLLILDDRGEQEPISPWCRGVHVNKDPPLLGSFPTNLGGSHNIFISVVMMQI